MDSYREKGSDPFSQPNDAVMRQVFGWGLLSTGQFERVAAEGLPWHKAAAVSVLGRQEEALMLGQRQAAEGEVSTLINELARTEQYPALVEFIESRWPDLAAFEKEYPDGGSGFSDMIGIASAYAHVGNTPRFEDAMERVCIAHEKSRTQGVRASFFLRDDARYFALAGDNEQAIAVLSAAVDQGLLLAVRADKAWPELKVLAGDPEFEAIQARMNERMNSERAALGLEPMQI